jgi:hypothetical protein
MFLLCSYRGMTQTPHAPATPPDGTTNAPERAAVERDWAVLELEVLHELARIGTAIAERVNQQHAAAVAATPPGAARAALHRDVARAFLRIARAVRLTLAMFGRVREAREALAAGAVLPTTPVVPERPQPSAGAGQRTAAEAARAPGPDLDDLDRDLEAEGDKRDDENPDDGPAPAKRAHGSNRPDRESLTELADFGFSLKNCGPGEVIVRIYRDLGLPPDPARWPQAWPASQAEVPVSVGAPAKVFDRARAASPESAPAPATLNPGIPARPAAPAHPSDSSPPDPQPEPSPPPAPEAGPAPSGDPPMPSARQHGPSEDSS